MIKLKKNQIKTYSEIYRQENQRSTGTMGGK